MVGKQKERPVATRQNQSRIRPPTTTATFVYQTPIPVCLPASNNGVCGILLVNSVFNQLCLLPSHHHPSEGLHRGFLAEPYTNYFRTGLREMAPIGEMAPGCAKKIKKEVFKKTFAPGAISRMIAVYVETVDDVGSISPVSLPP